MDDLDPKDSFPYKGPHSVDYLRIFRMMSEFVDGFEAMTSLGPAVAIFGSTNQHPIDRKYYDLAEVIAKKFVEKGFAIMTGGGSGIMECANKGAYEAKGKSCGLCINISETDQPNPYIHRECSLNFHYFFIRKVMFVRYAQGFVVFPGGFGTLDELFEALTLIQTEKSHDFPIYLVGKEYWRGLLDWLKHTVLARKNIKEADLSLIRVSDDVDEIVNGIVDHYSKIKSLENF